MNTTRSYAVLPGGERLPVSVPAGQSLPSFALVGRANGEEWSIVATGGHHTLAQTAERLSRLHTWHAEVVRVEHRVESAP